MSNFVHWKANYNNSQIIPIPANDHFVPINIRFTTNAFQKLGEFLQEFAVRHVTLSQININITV